MYLQSTRLTIPWNLGEIRSNPSPYTTYQWTPDPYICTVVVVLMVILTLMPAFCSLCYHILGSKENIRKVIFINLYFSSIQCKIYTKGRYPEFQNVRYTRSGRAFMILYEGA